jgi:hypothetical protein
MLSHIRNKQLLSGYAIRLTMGMVTFSWIGLQLAVIGECLQQPGDALQADIAFKLGLICLLYSLNLVLRLRRHEAEPTREAAQLFFGGLLLVLPLATWLVLRYMKAHLVGTGKAYLYLSLGVSVIYFAFVLTWLQTNVNTYTSAHAGSVSNRIMRILHSALIEPYKKD